MATRIGYQRKRTGSGLNEQEMTSCSKYTNERALQHNAIKSACKGLYLPTGSVTAAFYSIASLWEFSDLLALKKVVQGEGSLAEYICR